MNLMMVDELGLEPWDEEESQGLWKQGLVTMLSFWFFGAIPVVGYAIIDAAGVDNASTIFAADCVVTLFTMFALCAYPAPPPLPRLAAVGCAEACRCGGCAGVRRRPRSRTPRSFSRAA
eukprot:COSAG04_NODE_16780_length_489_cov_0.946154_1_plen_119_part_00